MGKRGQVTLFIILGILVLLLISLLLYLYQSQLTKPEYVEPEYVPIKNYVDGCMDLVAQEGLKILGKQGGYIELPQDVIYDSSAHISYGKGIIKVPYWFYRGRDKMPFLTKEDGIPSIQEQLENYVSKSLPLCLGDFAVFSDQFEITPAKSITTEVSIDEEFVNVFVNYNLKIQDTKEKNVGSLMQFRASVQVQFKKIYETAQQIMKEENDKMFFEQMTLDLMSMNKKIPFSDLTFDCNGKQWFLFDIQKEIKDMLYYAIPQIRIYNTEFPPFEEKPETYEELRQYTPEDFFNGNYPKEEAPADVYDYFNYFWDVRIPKNDLKVGFAFLKDWNLDIDAFPSDNGILKSNLAKGSKQFLSFMCLNMYHFTYDLEYPVEVRIRDDSAFLNEGYTFQFAFPVIIEHNNGNREKLGPNLYETLIPSSGYCTDMGEEIYDVRATGTDDYGLPGVELDDVNISYNCFKFRCDLGRTDADGGIYRLQTALPVTCVHGYLTGEKEGYLKGETQAADQKIVEVKLRRLKKFNYTMIVNQVNSGKIDDSPREFPSYLAAYITLSSFEEPSLLQYKRFPLSEDDTDVEKSIMLLEENHKYRLEILIVDELDDTIIGGYRCNWTVNYAELQGNNRIIFHTLEYNPKPMNDAQKIYTMLNYLDAGVYCEEVRSEFEFYK